MFEFAWLWAFLLLPLPLLYRFLPAKKSGEQAAMHVPLLTEGLTAGQAPKRNVGWKKWLAVVIWCLLVASAARPQWLGEPISIPNEGRDLMLAVDLSGSMKVDDMAVQGKQVNRLAMIKYVLTDFIQRRIGDRLGLILFADTAYLQTPLTYDRDTVAQMLDETVIGLVGEQTAIGDAVGLAIKRFQQKDESNRVLVLLTDGQNTAGNIAPSEAKELAVSEGIKVYTIGVGADQMLVRGIFGNRRVNPSQDLDENMLTDLAESTGGQYFRARDTESLAQIYALLDELEPIARESKEMRPLQALFYYPLAVAMLLAMLWMLQPLLSAFLYSQKEAV
ncbi:MAG: VWA domain-containing protein [Aestuariibacter sp.]